MVVDRPENLGLEAKGQVDGARFPRLRGASPSVRASLRARLEEGHGGPVHEYLNVTPAGTLATAAWQVPTRFGPRCGVRESGTA